jgi:FMN-dependent NADH-azoreductase
VPYLKSIMGFMGIEDFEVIVVEGVDAIPDRAETFKVAAAKRARKVAIQF